MQYSNQGQSFLLPINHSPAYERGLKKIFMVNWENLITGSGFVHWDIYFQYLTGSTTYFMPAENTEAGKMHISWILKAAITFENDPSIFSRNRWVFSFIWIAKDSLPYSSPFEQLLSSVWSSTLFKYFSWLGQAFHWKVNVFHARQCWSFG